MADNKSIHDMLTNNFPDLINQYKPDPSIYAQPGAAGLGGNYGGIMQTTYTQQLQDLMRNQLAAKAAEKLKAEIERDEAPTLDSTVHFAVWLMNKTSLIWTKLGKFDSIEKAENYVKQVVVDQKLGNSSPVFMVVKEELVQTPLNTWSAVVTLETQSS